jgi:1,2-dihydroxy-3-keto-5-methylthiopentene dioxygenase
MTLLQVMADDDAAEVRLRTNEADLINIELATRGITLDHWPVAADLDVSRPAAQILAEYAEPVATINRDGRYRHIDVAGLRPDDNDPDWQTTATTARSKFLAEHRHAEDEVRFFIAGRGCFYLHFEPEVLAVVCESGDVLSVPAGTRHWFDMGTRPDFAAIRFFEREDGWIGDFTGDAIGQRFPSLDQLVAT